MHLNSEQHILTSSCVSASHIGCVQLAKIFNRVVLHGGGLRDAGIRNENIQVLSHDHANLPGRRGSALRDREACLCCAAPEHPPRRLGSEDSVRGRGELAQFDLNDLLPHSSYLLGRDAARPHNR